LPKIDIDALPALRGSRYPAPFDEPCRARSRKRLGQAGGLTGFGVNLLTLPPGAWSSQRHWHSDEDELVFVVEGEVVLITDAGETRLAAGDCATFKAGVADGHQLVNRTDRDARVLEVGAKDQAKDRTVYSDADMIAEPGEDFYRRRDGAAYPKG
jgi:uncharacterized cupin superfamily protein